MSAHLLLLPQPCLPMFDTDFPSVNHYSWLHHPLPHLLALSTFDSFKSFWFTAGLCSTRWVVSSLLRAFDVRAEHLYNLFHLTIIRAVRTHFENVWLLAHVTLTLDWLHKALATTLANLPKWDLLRYNENFTHQQHLRNSTEPEFSKVARSSCTALLLLATVFSSGLHTTYNNSFNHNQKCVSGFHTQKRKTIRYKSA